MRPPRKNHCRMSDQPCIPLCVPSLSGNESRYLQQGLDSTFVSSVGPFVEQFEQQFSQFVGSRHAVACSSGTAALHVAMRLLNVGPGDEVLVPTLTFIASANPIAYERATPVFVDAEPRTWNLDCQAVVDEILRRAAAGLKQPKAVEVVHILGHPADMAELVDVCERHGIAMIEDATEALGASYRTGSLAGRHVVTIGRVGCFSFNGNKIMTTGGGGMIVTDDEQTAQLARSIRNQGRDTDSGWLAHPRLGYNFRLSDINCALGIAQLERIDEMLAGRRRVAELYLERLAGETRLRLQRIVDHVEMSWFVFVVRLRDDYTPADRDRILGQLRDRGIGCSNYFAPIHLQPFYVERYGHKRGDFPVCEALADRSIALPFHHQMTEGDVDTVCTELSSILGNPE